MAQPAWRGSVVRTGRWRGPGEEHSITLLTGSMKDGDKIRSLEVKFKIASEEEVDKEDRENWVKTTAEAQGDHEDATFWVQPFETGEDSKLRISGEGWTDASGEGGSTISVKVQYEAEPNKTGQYSRTDDVINDYLVSKGRAKDPTSWALLVPEGAAEEDPEHGLFTVKRDGSFDIEVDAPEELRNGEPGQYLTIFAQAGRNMDDDVNRAGTSDHSRRLWTVLAFMVWHGIFVEKRIDPQIEQRDYPVDL